MTGISLQIAANPAVPAEPLQYPAFWQSPEINRIAMRALTELGIALALTLICFPFIPKGMITVMIAISIGSWAVNTITHIFAHLLRMGRPEHLLVKAFCSSNFYRASGSNAMILIHESGHASAAKILFGGSPSIRILPFVGGWTSHPTKALTSLGQKLGYRRSMFLISLAGPALALLASSITLIAGMLLRDSCPNASTYLIGVGLYEFLNHAEYAYSALSTTPDHLGHDFVRLKTFGINPIAATISIIAIPILILTGFLLLNTQCRQLNGLRPLNPTKELRPLET